MAHRLVVLYEDSRGPVQRFPLHELVVKSAADLTSLPVHELFRRVVAVPKRGVNKVLDELARCDRLMGRGACVLAWVDNDGIRRALGRATACPRGEAISAIKARAPGPRRPEVFVLDDNLEDLLSSVGPQLDQALLAKALEKRLDDRDILLDEIQRSKPLRAALRKAHDGFACVSRFVACVAAMEPWPVPLRSGA